MNEQEQTIVDTYVQGVQEAGVEDAEAYLAKMGEAVTDEVKAAIAEAMKPQPQEDANEVAISEGEMQEAETANAVA